MQFFKMHNIGNDYIFTFERLCKSEIIKLCDRNFGIGGDGVVYVYNNGKEYGYEIYNKDGSRADFCGSVTLALGLYIYKKDGNNNFKIETDCGKKDIEVQNFNGRIRVSMTVGSVKFPLPKENFNKRVEFTLNDRLIKTRMSVVDIGNKHLVIRGIFNEQIRREIVSLIEKSKEFNSGINIEFVERQSSSRARVIVYERGSGKTLCCTSGGCAVFALLYKLGHFDSTAELIFDGGKLAFEMIKGKITVHSYPQFVFFGNRCDL